MQKPVTIWTLDWVPAGESGPRGFVRDLRLRWACEEAGVPYEVKTVPIGQTTPEHLARQPFGQVPFLDDGDIQLFESGACLLHLAQKSEALMPKNPKGAAEAMEWVIAALNSIEMVTVPWWFLGLSGKEENPLEGWVNQRLGHLEAVIQQREWLAAGRFTVADLLMADVLRIPKVRSLGKYPALNAYVDRVLARPAFKRAYDAQMAHFAAAEKSGG